MQDYFLSYLIFININSDNYIKAYKNIFSGDRDKIREDSVIFALDLVLEFIKN